MLTKYLSKIFIILILLNFSACSKEVKTGYVIDPIKLESIKVGKSKIADVEKILGSPSFVSTANDYEWYYVGSNLKQKAIKKPSVIKNEILTVRFDKKGVVSYVSEQDTTAKSRDIKFVQEYTKTEGNDVNALEQFLGNIGKYNDTVDKDSK